MRIDWEPPAATHHTIQPEPATLVDRVYARRKPHMGI